MKLIYNVIGREIMWIIKDTDLILMIIAAPVFYSLFYGSMYINKSESKVPIAILDMDHTQSSKEFVKDLNASQYIRVNEYLNSSRQIEDRLMNEDVQGVIFIPSGFESDINQMRGTEIKLYLNTQRFLHSNDLNKAVNQVALASGEEVRTKVFESKGFSYEQAKELSSPLNDEVIFLFNPGESYGDFLIPAILILILQQTLFMGLGQSMAKENEENKLNELLEAGGNNLLAAVTGKVLFYVILFLSYALLFFTLHYQIFKLNFAGSYFTFILLTVLMLTSMCALSIFIGSFFSKKIHALILISFTSYPLFFFAGYSWPTFAMPKLIQLFSYMVPATPYMHAINRVSMMGAGINQVLPELINLAALAIFFITLAMLKLKSVIKSGSLNQKNQ